MSDISVSIGLLWDEPYIRGELIGGYEVLCNTGNGHGQTLDRTATHFEARAAAGKRGEGYCLRLAESFSLDHAELTLSFASDLVDAGNLQILFAGRDWETDTARYDNMVWWPVVRVNSPAHAASLMKALRGRPGLDPLGFTVVKVHTEDPFGFFEFTLGDVTQMVTEVRAQPLNDVSVFSLYDVPVGRGFHWEHKEQLEYRGSLRLFQPAERQLTVVNVLPLEQYLESAVGSEMRSDLPPAFSQALAIAARSTVLATANRHHLHDGFDLCNDDHCQCYQGTSREAKAVVSPVRETAGKVLVFHHSIELRARKAGGEREKELPKGSGPEEESLEVQFSKALDGIQEVLNKLIEMYGKGKPVILKKNRIVDARYSKSCGGVSERYEAAWGAEDHPYFDVRACGDFPVPDLTDESEARRFLQNPPPAWCNPELHPYPDPWDKDPLYRWTRGYTRAELGRIIHDKTGLETGAVRSLQVKRRGASGRILILEIVGEKDTTTIYGELNIRRALSPSHLPSSFFVCDISGDTITLHGGGWGHGVGLCQLGAAAMAKAGKSVEEILEHYYPKSEMKRI